MPYGVNRGDADKSETPSLEAARVAQNGTKIRMTGRPTDYNETLAAAICERLVEGESLRAVCRDPDMPAISSVMLWLTKHPSFTEQYAKATEERAHGMFEDMLDIADDAEEEASSVAKARLRVDTRKWALSKMMPKKYGDKIAHVGGDPATDNPIQSQGTIKVEGLSESALREIAALRVEEK